MKRIDRIIKTFKDKNVPIGDKISLAALLVGLVTAAIAFVLATIGLSVTIASIYYVDKQTFVIIMCIISGILVILIGLWLTAILFRRASR